MPHRSTPRRQPGGSIRTSRDPNTSSRAPSIPVTREVLARLEAEADRRAASLAAPGLVHLTRAEPPLSRVLYESSSGAATSTSSPARRPSGAAPEAVRRVRLAHVEQPSESERQVPYAPCRSY